MKKRSTIANYIEEVCDYEAGYERCGIGEYSYPPIVLKLLLSILIRLSPFSNFLSLALGFLIGVLSRYLLMLVLG